MRITLYHKVDVHHYYYLFGDLKPFKTGHKHGSTITENALLPNLHYPLYINGSATRFSILVVITSKTIRWAIIQGNMDD